MDNYLVCSKIEKIIVNEGYIPISSINRKDKCIILFRHPSVKENHPYLISSVYYLKDKNYLEVTARRKVKNYKELYLDYCCEKNVNVCRPHILVDDENVLSIEAKFHENILEKFKRLLDDIY